MSEAWTIDAARTPRGVGKLGKGALWEIHPQKLLSTVLGALAERNDLNTEEVDDIVISCSSQIKNRALVSAECSPWMPDIPSRPQV